MSWIRKLFKLPPKKKNPFTKEVMKEHFEFLDQIQEREKSLSTEGKSEYVEPPPWISEPSRTKEIPLDELEELRKESSKSPTTPGIKGLSSSPTIYWTPATKEQPSRIKLWLNSIWLLFSIKKKPSPNDDWP